MKRKLSVILKDVELLHTGAPGDELQRWPDLGEVRAREVEDRFCMVYHCVESVH